MNRKNEYNLDGNNPSGMFKDPAFVAALLALPQDVKDEALLSATAGLEITLGVIDSLKESIVRYLSPNGSGKFEVTPEKLQFVMAVAGAISMKEAFDVISAKHKAAVQAASVAGKSGYATEQPEPPSDDVSAAMEAIAKIIGK